MSKKQMQISTRGKVTVLNLGDMEIWDGADMALLRDTLTRMITKEKHRALGIDMHAVKYIPSGFFGMLFDWHEMGVRMYLYAPQPNVEKMLWFRRFFVPADQDGFELRPEIHGNEPLPFSLSASAIGTPNPWAHPAPSISEPTTGKTVSAGR